MATWPLAESTSTLGMKYGETRSGPLVHDRALLHDPDEAADRRPEDNADARRVEAVQPRVSFASTAAASASRTFRSSRRASFALTRPLGVEVLDLGGDPDRELARVERFDEVDAALARDGGAPGRGRVVAERRDCSQTRDGDSSHRGQLIGVAISRSSPR